MASLITASATTSENKESKEANEVKTFLHKHNLDQYFTNFVDDGYDTMKHLSNIKFEDLTDIGLKKGHARTLLHEIGKRMHGETKQSTSTLKFSSAPAVLSMSTANRSLSPSAPPTFTSSLHKVTVDAAAHMRTSTPRKTISTMIYNESVVPRVIRIVLTGGPCGGKSSCLEHLSQRATKSGFDVLIAPETPTILFNSGVDLSSAASNPSLMAAFQTNVVDLQLQLERTMTSIASKTGRPTILILDRGMMDGKAFCNAEQWQTVLENTSPVRSTRMTEAYILQRYDAVVHLETAAANEETKEYYKHGWTKDDSGRSVFRRETPEEAAAADKRLIHAYRNHVKHVYVPSGKSFEEKLNSVSNAVLEIAQEKYPL